MDKEQLLKKLGLTEKDLQEYRESHAQLAKTLSAEQRELVDRMRPVSSKVIKAFDGDVTEMDLLELFDRKETQSVLVTCLPGGHHKHKQ